MIEVGRYQLQLSNFGHPLLRFWRDVAKGEITFASDLPPFASYSTDENGDIKATMSDACLGPMLNILQNHVRVVILLGSSGDFHIESDILTTGNLNIAGAELPSRR